MSTGLRLSDLLTKALLRLLLRGEGSYRSFFVFCAVNTEIINLRISHGTTSYIQVCPEYRQWHPHAVAYNAQVSGYDRYHNSGKDDFRIIAIVPINTNDHTIVDLTLYKEYSVRLMVPISLNINKR